MAIPAHSRSAPDGVLFAALRAAALEAGRVIMKFYAEGCAVERKQDASPVTEADRPTEAVILSAIASAAPDIPVVAEEEASAGRLPVETGRRFLLVDPLDGTREFLARNGDFTVNIALIEDGLPVAGIVYAPARHLLFTGGADGAAEIRTTPGHEIAESRAIRARIAADGPVAVCSRSHDSPQTAAFLREKGITERVSVGSSLKFCLIARGEADIYPRFTPTMQWDTAAGDAVLRAAGGTTLAPDGHPLVYGPRVGQGAVEGPARFINPHFVACGAGDLFNRL